MYAKIDGKYFVLVVLFDTGPEAPPKQNSFDNSLFSKNGFSSKWKLMR